MLKNAITKVQQSVGVEGIKPTIAAAICLTSTVMATISPAMCEINGNSAMQNFLKILFSLLVFVGIVLIIAGAVSLIRVVMSVSAHNSIVELLRGMKNQLKCYHVATFSIDF